MRLIRLLAVVMTAGLLSGALTWQATKNLTTSSFAEYKRLEGPAANSSLVKEKGAHSQFVIGLSASYKFNFTN